MALPTSSRSRSSRPIARSSREVDEVQLPGAEGYFGVLPGHTPLLATLQVGELWYRIGSEALPGDRVRLRRGAARSGDVLAQIAERAEEIDVAARRGGEAAAPRSAGDVDFERARIALMKSLVRIQVASAHEGQALPVRPA
jgi:F-type H+-transporting ATPase subunit epsilon